MISTRSTWDRGREGGREEGREGGREEGREGGREGGRKKAEKVGVCIRMRGKEKTLEALWHLVSHDSHMTIYLRP